VMKTKTNQGH